MACKRCIENVCPTCTKEIRVDDSIISDSKRTYHRACYHYNNFRPHAGDRLPQIPETIPVGNLVFDLKTSEFFESQINFLKLVVEDGDEWEIL